MGMDREAKPQVTRGDNLEKAARKMAEGAERAHNEEIKIRRERAESEAKLRDQLDRGRPGRNQQSYDWSK